MKNRKLFSLAGFISLFLVSMSCQDLVDEVVGKKPEDTRNINITMIAKSSSNPVFQSARVGAEDAAKDLSEKHSSLEVTINWRTPLEEDPQGQAERIKNAVEDGTDAILLSCSDEEILTPVINSVVDSGVPVMTFDSDASDSKRFAFYGPDDREIGERVMSELAALLNNEGQVAILGGSQNAPNLRKRVEGVQEKAREYPGIEIVGVFYHVETAEAAAKELMRVNDEYPELKGWAMVGGWPFFNDELLDKLDPQAQKIVAVDALPMQLPYLEKGIVDVLLGQPTFKWGKVSVETIIDKIYLNKEVPAINQMKLIRVSQENLGGWARQLRAWGYENVPRRFLTM